MARNSCDVKRVVAAALAAMDVGADVVWLYLTARTVEEAVKLAGTRATRSAVPFFGIINGVSYFRDVGSAFLSMAGVRLATISALRVGLAFVREGPCRRRTRWVPLPPESPVPRSPPGGAEAVLRPARPRS